MIPLMQAQINSDTYTEKSLSRRDKRKMKKLEKEFDKEILKAGDLMEKETSFEYYVRCKMTPVKIYNVSDLILLEDITYFYKLINEYKVQGYFVQYEKSVLSEPTEWFDDRKNRLVLTITLKWDKDYSFSEEN